MSDETPEDFLPTPDNIEDAEGGVHEKARKYFEAVISDLEAELKRIHHKAGEGEFNHQAVREFLGTTHPLLEKYKDLLGFSLMDVNNILLPDDVQPEDAPHFLINLLDIPINLIPQELLNPAALPELEVYRTSFEYTMAQVASLRARMLSCRMSVSRERNQWVGVSYLFIASFLELLRAYGVSSDERARFLDEAPPAQLSDIASSPQERASILAASHEKALLDKGVDSRIASRAAHQFMIEKTETETAEELRKKALLESFYEEFRGNFRVFVEALTNMPGGQFPDNLPD